MATVDLDELRAEIELDQKSLNEKKAALRYLESKEGKGSELFLGNVDVLPNAGLIQLDKLGIPASNKRTLLSEVEEVISRFGDQEFSVAHVDTVLKQRGLKDKKGEDIDRARISTSMGQLEKSGVVERTFTGGGKIPHRYKRIQKAAGKSEA